MYNELSIKTPGGEFFAFLQEGFYNNLSCSPVHNHNYTEVHLILDGSATFVIEGKTYVVESERMLIIPRKVMHTCIKQDENTMHSAFQINYDQSDSIAKFEVYPIDEKLLRRFFDELPYCRGTNDYTTISAFMAFFCHCFYKGERIESMPVIDYGFAIHEFFLTHYNEDPCLSDLANMLHLSERQTERLVLKHMGGTFRKTLAATRAMIAKQLMDSSDMSLTEIAEYVGYRSYAGFWKAMKRFN